MHQLRVAAVGSLIVDRVSGVDKKTIIVCGLFHDMANILKIDLSREGNLAVDVSDDERARLQQLKEEYRDKYGGDEHQAAMEIGREIGLPQTVLDMIDNMRFLRSEWVLDKGTIEMKIAKYSDLRVSPFGIVSMRERFDEAARRYRHRGFGTEDKESAEMRGRMDAVCWKLEALLMEKARMRSDDITDHAAAPIIEELKKYEIS